MLTFYLDCNFVVLGGTPTSEGSVSTQGQRPPVDLCGQPGVGHRCPALGQLLEGVSQCDSASGPSLRTCLLVRAGSVCRFSDAGLQPPKGPLFCRFLCSCQPPLP